MAHSLLFHFWFRNVSSLYSQHLVPLALRFIQTGKKTSNSGSCYDSCFDCINLYTGLPYSLERSLGMEPLWSNLGIGIIWNFIKTFLEKLTGLVFNYFLYFHGVVIHHCHRSNGPCSRDWSNHLDLYWRIFLHCRSYHSWTR